LLLMQGTGNRPGELGFIPLFWQHFYCFLLRANKIDLFAFVTFKNEVV
jgi:hypothetical protein